jgi:transcription antitermination factor NusG
MSDNTGSAGILRKSSPDGWLVIITKPNQVGLALAQLAAQDYEPFLPLTLSERKIGRKIVQVRVPLFGGYIFVPYTEGETDWGPIISTRGVCRIIASRTGVPLLLGDDVIAEIRGRMDESSGVVELEEAVRTIWVKDDPVAIVEGPLAGFSGLFVSNEGDRVMVLLDLLGRRHVVPIPVLSVDPSRKS